MATTTIQILPLYPSESNVQIPQNAYMKIDIKDDVNTLTIPSTLYIRCKFTHKTAEDYPGGIDPYNTGLQTNVLTDMASIDTDSRGFDMVHKSISGFVGAATAYSGITTIVAGKHYNIRVAFDKYMQYGLKLQLEVQVQNDLAQTRIQQHSFSVEERPYYSPALGDQLTDFETAVQATNLDVFPYTKKLRTVLLQYLDARSTEYSLRKLTEILLAKHVRFADLETETKQILAGYRTKDFKPVYSPRKYFDIATDLGDAGLIVMKQSAIELSNSKIIPASVIGPIEVILNSSYINKTYRTAAAVGLVSTAVKVLAGF